MRIESVEVVRVELELVAPLATSQGTHAARPLVLVRITTTDAVGSGECAALAEPIYTSEDADGAEAALCDLLVPAMLVGGPEADGAAAFFARLETVPGHPMAKAAVEMALLDAEMRAAGRSIADLVGAKADVIEAGATIGIAAPDDAARIATELVSGGFRRIKVKIAPGHDTDVVLAVRRAIGFTAMSVDANGAYRADDGRHLAALRLLDELGLSAIEQPFAAADLAAHVMLRRLIRTPIVLDESITNLDDLERAIAFGAADAISIKSARLGGVFASMAICRRARRGGVGLVVGGMLESGIGRSVAIALGASEGFTMTGDLGPSGRYFARDLTAPHEMVDGMLSVPRGPGIGVAVDEEAISSFTRRNTLVNAP
ncbi:MAG TPA: o-succinylbenzoate synthase [Acidimicrobiales bacterium]|nr:o-succinylbenzoate synthase [Acidimicrobiales bacterium]